MESKPTCGVLYAKAVSIQCDNDDDRKVFAAGFVHGQAEKVYLGACRAAMFRPQIHNEGWLKGVVCDAAELYRLTVWEYVYHDNGKRIFEIWLSDEKDPRKVWEPFPVNHRLWHLWRGRMCGIPEGEIDEHFHLRRGFNEPCDGDKPTDEPCTSPKN